MDEASVALDPFYSFAPDTVGRVGGGGVVDIVGLGDLLTICPHDGWHCTCRHAAYDGWMMDDEWIKLAAFFQGVSSSLTFRQGRRKAAFHEDRGLSQAEAIRLPAKRTPAKRRSLSVGRFAYLLMSASKLSAFTEELVVHSVDLHLRTNG